MMPIVRVIVVTGLPGVGKSTLARQLSGRYRLPLIAKDLIKEPLLEVLGAADAAQSRRLSDASFAALFCVAKELRQAGSSFLLEGNFRPGEQEAALRDSLGSATVAQILCRLPEPERLARLKTRAAHPTRHAGHRHGEQLSARAPSMAGDAFLELPSARFVHDGTVDHPVLAGLDDWMNLRAASL